MGKIRGERLSGERRFERIGGIPKPPVGQKEFGAIPGGIITVGIEFGGADEGVECLFILMMSGRDHADEDLGPAVGRIPGGPFVAAPGESVILTGIDIMAVNPVKRRPLFRGFDQNFPKPFNRGAFGIRFGEGETTVRFFVLGLLLRSPRLLPRRGGL